MSFKKFRNTDVLVFCILAAIFEFINYFASTHFDSFKLIFLSYTVLITYICMFRWGIMGSLVALVGGLSACIASKSFDYITMLAYIVGDLVGMIISYFAFINPFNKNKLKKNKALLVISFILSFVAVSFTKCLIFSLFEQEIINSLFSNLKEELIYKSMSLIISLVIVVIASNTDFLVEMKSYIKHVQDYAKLGHLKDYKSQKNFNFDKPFTEEGEIDEAFLLDGGQLTHEQLKELDDMYHNNVPNNKDEKGG